MRPPLDSVVHRDGADHSCAKAWRRWFLVERIVHPVADQLVH